MNFLSVAGVSRQERGNETLKGISFTQEQYRKLAVAGETGSGKSSLLKVIAGLYQANEGVVHFEGKKVLGPHEKLIPGHPAIAYLSQQYELPINLRVEQVLEYANEWTEEEGMALYKVCQIDHLMKRRTNQLSGGEKQRIALARLLSMSPRLLLLDEPFSNLDMMHKNTLKAVIRDVGERLSLTCILVSHDPQDVLSWADEILVMKDGAIVQQASPEQLYRQPANEYVAALFGKYNIMQGEKGRMMIRPEDLRIVAEEHEESLRGKVLERSFWGYGYEMEVKLGASQVTVRTVQGGFDKGDTVFLALPEDGIWYI